MAQHHARRVCPACARRFGGLVAPSCRICQGTGVLGLGAAALAQHSAPAVARTVELYLELRAQASGPLPQAQRPEVLEAAVLELRSAGVLAHSLEAGAPATVDPSTPTAAERSAYRAVHTITGTPLPTTVPAALAAPPIDVADARPDRITATASANGHRAHLHRLADPLTLDTEPLHAAAQQQTDRHAARVLAHATDRLARKARPA